MLEMKKSALASGDQTKLPQTEAGTAKMPDISSKAVRLTKEIELLKAKLERTFEKRMLTDDPAREVLLENLEQKLEADIALKQGQLEKLR